MKQVNTDRKGETAAELPDVIIRDLSTRGAALSKVCDEPVRNIKTGTKTKQRNNILVGIPLLKKKQAQRNEVKKITPLNSTIEQTIAENKPQAGRITKNHMEKWEEEYLFCNSECRRLIGYITAIKIGFSIFLLSIVMLLCLLSSL